MSLPHEWVEKIFTKLTLAYGREFLGRWEGVDLNDVKTDWGHELSGFRDHPDAIAYALRNLPEKPPTVFQFRSIANKVPRPDLQPLPPIAPSAEALAKELQKLAGIKSKALATGEYDGKEWARRILRRFDSGESIRPVSLRFAREALRMAAP